MTTFAKGLLEFCEDLRLSFPEMVSQIDRVSSMSPADYLKTWRPYLSLLKTKDVQQLFQKRGGSLLGGVSLSKKLWAELSETTHTAIWKHLRSLVLEAVVETGLDKLKEEEMTTLMEIMMEEKIGPMPSPSSPSPGGGPGLFEHLKPLFDRLKEFMPNMDVSGSTAFPEIPERLRNGKIAKLAEELTKQFDPTEFGIDPSLLTGDNIEDIITKLSEIFQKDPAKLMAGAKKMAEKIKRKIMDGSIDRKQLVDEAQEFMKLFRENPMFKESLGKMESMMGPGGLASMFGSGSEAEPSERRSTVQERLRKKLAARKSESQSK
jgi:hypothetical protein